MGGGALRSGERGNLAPGEYTGGIPRQRHGRPATSRLPLAVAALVLFGPTPLWSAEKALTNTKCPVLTGEDVNPNISVTYQGKTIYLCCPMCRQKFLAEPTKYLANLPQFALASREHTRGTPTAHSPGAETPHGHEGGHDHATDHGPSGSLATFLGKFHPVMIHFPIALILTAGLAELLLLATRRTFFADVARFLLPLAAASAVVAMLLGLAAESGASFPQELVDYVEWHEVLGITTTVLAVACTLLGEVHRRVRAPWALVAYRISLGLAMLVVGVTGHLGATLVYGPDHFSM